MCWPELLLEPPKFKQNDLFYENTYTTSKCLAGIMTQLPYGTDSILVYNRAGNICWTKMTCYKSWRVLISAALFHHNFYIKYTVFTHASSRWVVIRGGPEAKLKTRVNCEHLWAPFGCFPSAATFDSRISFKSRKTTICITMNNRSLYQSLYINYLNRNA